MGKDTSIPQLLPPFRFYCSPIIQGLALFMVLVGWGHTTWTWAWMLGCYLFTMVGITAAYAQEQLFSTSLPRAAFKDDTERLSFTEVYGSRTMLEVIRAYENAMERLADSNEGAYWKLDVYLKDELLDNTGVIDE